MKTTTNTPPTKPILVMITNTDAVYYFNGELQVSEIQDDQDGMLYYFAGNKAQYLPKVFQPVQTI